MTRKSILPEKLWDDLAGVAGGLAALASGCAQSGREAFRQRRARFAEKLDAVPREDFERLEEMTRKARENQEDIERRLQALETRNQKKNP